MIRATIKVIPWGETHVIQARSYDQLKKDYYGIFGRAMLEVKKKKNSSQRLSAKIVNQRLSPCKIRGHLMFVFVLFFTFVGQLLWKTAVDSYL